MSNRAELTRAIRQIIQASWPARFAASELRSDVPLDEGGLGLDSVEIVEVLFACEDACGVRAGEELFDLAPLTIERLADHFAQAVA
jgi:acyl carrier protein